MIPTRRFLLLFAAGLVPLAGAGVWPELVAVVAGYDAALAALFLADAVHRSRGLEIAARRIHEPRLSLGEDNPVRVELENFGRSPVVALVRDDPPHAFGAGGLVQSVRIEAFGRVRLRYTLRPKERGDYAFGDVHLRVAGRLGLAAVDFRVEAARPVKVYPNLVDVARYRHLARTRQLHLMGLVSSEGVSRGQEFEELRDYAPGDDYRAIDWKASARRFRPVTQLHRPERSQNVVLCLDAGRMMATRVGDASKLDHAVNAALMLGFTALEHGDNVGLALYSDGLDAFVAPRRGRSALQRILAHLYGVKPNYTAVDFRELSRQLAGRIRRRSLVVFFTDLIDEEGGETLLASIRVLRPRHLPLVVSMTDDGIEGMARGRPDGVRAVYERAVATRMLRERSLKIAALASEGIDMIEGRPGELAVRTVNRYLQLKSAGRL